jgi:hypothetical protein
VQLRLSGWVLQASQPWGQDGRRAWLRWTERLLPEPKQPGLVQPELQKRQRAQPGLRALKRQAPELWGLLDREQVLPDVILKTGQALWARLPELRP